MAATVDIISNGRLIFGIGAGWFELEHQVYDIPFPPIGERLISLDESLTLIKKLWTQETANFTGRHHHLHDAPFEPKPIQQPHPPILVGAAGEKIALGIVARHADMWNTFGSPETFRHKIEVLAEHCAHIGRDPDEIEKSVLISTTFSSDDNTRQLIEDYIAMGVTHIIFSISSSTDPQLLHHFAQEVMPALRH